MKDQPTHYHLTKTNGTSDYTPVSTVLPVSKVKTKQEDTRLQTIMNLIKHSNGVTKRAFTDQSQYPVRPSNKPSYQTPLMSQPTLSDSLNSVFNSKSLCTKLEPE